VPSPGADPALNLRPLSLGEVFDRAFHLYFKHLAAFTALIAVVVVPMAILSYFQSRDIIDFYVNFFQQMMQHPNKPPDPKSFESLQQSGPLTGAVYLFAFFAVPVAQAAIVSAVSKAYLGLRFDFRDSYRFALSRWLAILILVVIWVCFAVAAAIVLMVIAFFFFFTVGFALTRAAGGPNPLFAGSATIFFLSGLILGLGVGAMLYVAYALSFIAVVVERVDPLTAFASGFRRIFFSNEVWRSFAIALALFTITLGAELVMVGAGLLGVLLLKTPALYAISVGLLSLFVTPFALVTAAVFYYDIRIRHEGYDLQMMAERFAAPVASS
jgi:hypothetical protein